MNRLEKIKLLNDITAGRIRASDLQPETVEMWLIDEAGMYVEPYLKLRFSKVEFEAYKVKARNRTMFVPDERFDWTNWTL